MPCWLKFRQKLARPSTSAFHGATLLKGPVVTHRSPSRWTYAGLFLVTLATVTYEVLLTRIFSVIMWYHFAFVAVSVAMFGMSFGAVLVYVLPEFFRTERTEELLAYSAIWFAVSMVLCSLCQDLPVFVHYGRQTLLSLAWSYITTAVPFTLSGVCVCLALTRYPSRTPKLYAADLIGAACGCLAMIGLLRFFSGPNAVLVIAAVAAVAGVMFSQAGSSQLRWVSYRAVLLVVCVAAASVLLQGTRFSFTKLRVAKGVPEPPVIYEKWNHFSRVTVSPVFLGPPPFGWGLSPSFKLHRPPQRELALFIDSNAATPITNYRGDTSNLQHLKYDIINAAHYLRPESNILVVGAGGGRDILSALVFNQKSVVAVEINGDILKAVNRRFGDFSGHLDRDRRVQFVSDEARSYVTRQSGHFDIIQVSLVDTWAASSAGAFVLTENSLYTTQAWKTFISKLTDRGIVTFSRWYMPQSPWEMYRVTSLAAESLRESGVENPRNNIIILRRMGVDSTGNGIGTILVSKQPFSDSDIAEMQTYAHKMEFDVVLTPTFALDDIFGQIASSADVQKFTNTFPVDLSPPTDDRPFFFNMIRLRDLIHPEYFRQLMTTNFDVVSTLVALALFVVLLTVGCIVVPLALTADRTALHGSTLLFTYFGCIGMGFMLVEISQMQRLIVFLGHPTYALSVVLFSLLTFSGLGSLSTNSIMTRRQSTRRLGLLLLSLIGFGGATPAIVARFASAATPTRILLSVLILAPIGFLMGMAFPIGMKVAENRPTAITPWLWGINGATSVCTSVLAVIISLEVGITASFWVGAGAYLTATISFVFAGVTQEERLKGTVPNLWSHARGDKLSVPPLVAKS